MFVPSSLELLPPVIAGILTGVLRAVALFRKEEPTSIKGWQRWFVSYGRVPITTVVIGTLVQFLAAFRFVEFGDILATVEEVLVVVGILAALYSFVGALIGIPVAWVACVLLYDVCLWIDGGSEGE